MDQFNQTATAPAASRSALLTTMCILTWVWGGITILSSLFSFTSPFADPTKISIDLLANIGSVVAAVMMWKRNKTGLWIYLVCELVPYISAFAITGIDTVASSLSFFGSWIAGMIYAVFAFMIIIDGVFIFLYHLGLKQSANK